MKYTGAFAEACRQVIEEDLEAKQALLKDIIDNPDKYPKFTGQEILALIFGDYQAFVNKLNCSRKGINMIVRPIEILREQLGVQIEEKEHLECLRDRTVSLIAEIENTIDRLQKAVSELEKANL